jgi:hypothetical protein
VPGISRALTFVALYLLMAVIAAVAATLMSAAAAIVRLLGLRGRVILLRRRSLRRRSLRTRLLLRLRTVLHVRSFHALLWHRAVLNTRGFHAGLRLRLRLRPILSAGLRLL